MHKDYLGQRKIIVCFNLPSYFSEKIYLRNSFKDIIIYFIFISWTLDVLGIMTNKNCYLFNEKNSLFHFSITDKNKDG